jgi:predicted RNA-binding protein with PUA-like domain
MPNRGIHYRNTLRGLSKGDVLEFVCGRCGRVGVVTLLQLVRRRIPLDTCFDWLSARSFCRQCGRHDIGNRVRIRGRSEN